jgi:uncharacterized membrane protein
MVDTQKILELVPHYIAMLVLVFLAISVLRTALGESNLIVEFAVILVLVFLYPFGVRRLGVAPSHWE